LEKAHDVFDRSYADAAEQVGMAAEDIEARQGLLWNKSIAKDQAVLDRCCGPNS